MTTTFEVRGRAYELEISGGARSEGGPFHLYETSVRILDSEGAQVRGTLKLTDTALAAAQEKAAEKGGSAEEWLARGCARSLAAEVLIRKLRPGFEFVVDHRWIDPPRTEKKGPGGGPQTAA